MSHKFTNQRISPVPIDSKNISSKNPCYIIAEAGSNHDGSLEQAKRLIDAAAVAGVDAVKFQLFKAEALVIQDDEDFDLIKSIEFNRDWNSELSIYCRDKNVHYLATPFDFEAVDLLCDISSPALKVASGDITHFPLLEKMAKTKKTIILSTGKSNMEDVESAVEFLNSKKSGPLAILHCVASYPSQVEELNLRVLSSIKKRFKVPVGLSDHTMSTTIPAFAVCLGASIIEKHFTLNRNLPGPDHSYALEPDELTQMVKNIRIAEASLGDGVKKLSETEAQRPLTGRRGIYSLKPIKKGEVITGESVTFVRPQIGISSSMFDKIEGAKASRDIPVNTAFEESDIETGV